jgi:hypothetical protein
LALKWSPKLGLVVAAAWHVGQLHNLKLYCFSSAFSKEKHFFFGPETLNSNPWRQITLVRIEKSLYSQIRKPKQGLNVSLDV